MGGSTGVTGVTLKIKLATRIEIASLKGSIEKIYNLLEDSESLSCLKSWHNELGEELEQLLRLLSGRFSEYDDMDPAEITKLARELESAGFTTRRLLARPLKDIDDSPPE